MTTTSTSESVDAAPGDPGGQVEWDIDIGTVWVDVDPRFPRRRCQILKVDETLDLPCQLIDWRGMPLKSGAFIDRYTRFLPEGAWRPDDTGMPAPCIVVGGKLCLRLDEAPSPDGEDDYGADDSD